MVTNKLIITNRKNAKKTKALRCTDQPARTNCGEMPYLAMLKYIQLSYLLWDGHWTVMSLAINSSQLLQAIS